ncbi:MAG: tetratricopeptide repeat protein [Planctomycetia bacterium]
MNPAERMSRTAAALVLLTAVGCTAAEAPAADAPLTDADRAKMAAEFEATVARETARLKDRPDAVEAYSERGAALFHLGRFKDSVADFDKMIELEPAQEASHWRRGIALYYAGDFAGGAAQFQKYHSFDDVDRENGIWRFLCQTEAFGLEKARADLLKYKTDDRPPFADVYAMFAGKIEPADVLKRIEAAPLGDTERRKQKFYADLYVGLYLATLKKPAEAQKHLAAATANSWGRSAGGGPGYMWQVARLHDEKLRRNAFAAE